VEGPPDVITRLWHAVYRGRPDLQRAFPDVFGADAAAFREWMGVCGVAEQGAVAFAIPSWADGGGDRRPTPTNS
jgi:hypothetical protein